MPLNGVFDCRRQSSGICKFSSGGSRFLAKSFWGFPRIGRRDSVFSM
jgi:hypothetical protein